MADRDPLEILGAVAGHREEPGEPFAQDLLDDLLADLHRPDERVPDADISPIHLADDEEESPMNLLHRWRWIATAAAAAVVVAILVLVVPGDGDGGEVIVVNTTTEVPEPTVATTAPPATSSVPPTSDPADAGPPPLPQQLGRIYRGANGDPNVNPGLSQSNSIPVAAVAPGLYSLGLSVPLTIEIGEVESVPGGVAFTDQLLSGDLNRQLFFPAGAPEERYLAAIAPFRDPAQPLDPEARVDANILLGPFFEIIEMPVLGSTTAEVVQSIVDSELVVLSEPEPAEIAGVTAVRIEATATERLIVASGLQPDSLRQVLPAWQYVGGARLRFYVFEVDDTVLLAAISTTEVGFEEWAAAAEEYLAGLVAP